MVDNLSLSEKITMTQNERWSTLRFKFALWCINVLYWKVPHHPLYPKYTTIWDRLNAWAWDVYQWAWCEGDYEITE
jgi:hypothetical protein